MLDTDIASYIIKRRSSSIDAKLSALDPAQVCISAVTKAELQYGLKQLPLDHKLHIQVRHFLKIIRVLAWDSEAADFYTDIRYGLKIAGEPIGEMDMMIAAHSLAVPAVLVTNNMRHFSRIRAPLVLENWE